jgi:hypothetical protein
MCALTAKANSQQQPPVQRSRSSSCVMNRQIAGYLLIAANTCPLMQLSFVFQMVSLGNPLQLDRTPMPHVHRRIPMMATRRPPRGW